MDIQFVQNPEKSSASSGRRKTPHELELFIKALQARPGQWAVFSHHASIAAASGRRAQVRKAKRYRELDLEWDTRRMPTEENPDAAALITRWSATGYVQPLMPPPLGAQAMDKDGNVWRLYDFIPRRAAEDDGETESRLTWCALLVDKQGRPTASYLDNDRERERVRLLRIIFVPGAS